MNSLILALALLISCNYQKDSPVKTQTLNMEISVEEKVSKEHHTELSEIVNSSSIEDNTNIENGQEREVTAVEKSEETLKPSKKPVDQTEKTNSEKTKQVISYTQDDEQREKDTEVSKNPAVSDLPVLKDEDSESQPKILIEEAKDETEETPKGIHDGFNDLLGKYVLRSGSVNYSGFKTDISALNKYSTELSQIDPSGMSREAKLAFYINAYNAHTILLILENYPVKSIRDIAGGKPWDKKWILLEGKTLSLNQIENEIIRPQFKEPRIHFAVNCAAVSCPKLWNRAFTEENLNEALESLTKEFVNNKEQNQINSSYLKISRIFEWYASDFGLIKEFLNRYSTEKLAPTVVIEYMEYNWSLNGK